MSSRFALRAATLADEPAVAALIAGMGYRPRSAAAWRWLFEENPARAEHDRAPDIGWVLESGDGILGYLGNVPLSYVWNGKSIRAASCTDLYVLPAAGAEGTGLLRAFFRQPGVEVFLTTTANARTAAIYEMFDAAVPQDQSLAEEYVWVADDSVAVRDMLTKRKVPPALATAVASVTGPLAGRVRALAGFASVPRAPHTAQVKVLGSDDVDQRFEPLWRSAASAPGLSVRRDSTRVRWYLANPDAGCTPAVLAAFDGSGLIGYAAVTAHRSAGEGVGVLSVLDLLTLPGRENVIPALLEHAVAHARKHGIGFLYVRPCGASLASHLRKLQPRVQRFTQSMHYLRAADRSRTPELVRAGVWRATGLDGDAALCMEYRDA